MATEMITLKLESTFLKEIDSIVSTNGYQNRTEFIRNALRDKIEDINFRKSVIALRGRFKKKTSDEEIERIREKAFKELYG